MSNTPPVMNDYDAIAATVQHYIDGARAGSGKVMKQAFHDDAWIFGAMTTGPFMAPIQELFDRVDAGKPAPDTRANIVAIDIVETIATVRLELDEWSGRRFTDMFTMVKIDGQWTIMNKVFHLHT